MRCQHELLVAAKLRRTDATRVAVKPEEAYDRTDAHATLLAGVGDGSPAINRFDPRLRKSSEYGFAIHAGLLPVGSLNHIPAGMGIHDSAFSGNALVNDLSNFRAFFTANRANSKA